MCLLVPASTGLSSQDTSNTASRPGASAAMNLENCLMTELDWRKLVGRRFTKSLLAKEHQLGPQGNYRNPCGCKNRAALWNGCTSNKVLHSSNTFCWRNFRWNASEVPSALARLLWVRESTITGRTASGYCHRMEICVSDWKVSEQSHQKIVKFAHWTHR